MHIDLTEDFATLDIKMLAEIKIDFCGVVDLIDVVGYVLIEDGFFLEQILETQGFGCLAEK
ncbi:hypothetical protein [uncultured Helicobacter sp.]|uniref:hypothetical protein n=1 Tax=uncultured Helicobacter sp. TaxID=175537 RepID=UPI00260797E2|nr:hypothetical protein [uncultured Helicobacter sp.]